MTDEVQQHASPIDSNTLARALYARDAWRNKAELLRREAMQAGFWNEGMGQYWPDTREDDPTDECD